MKRRFLIVISIMLILSLTLSGCGVFSIAKNINIMSKDSKVTEIELTTAEPSPTAEPDLTEPDISDSGDDADKEDSAQDMDDISASNGGVLPNDYVGLVKKGVLKYDVFTITIPDYWDGRVYVSTFDEGLTFLEAKSYDTDEYSGFMFGVCKADNQIATYAGETYLAYSDDHFYYLTHPTDVPYNYEDPEAANAYTELCISENMVISSIEIDDPTLKYNVDEFVCPMSSYKAIPEEVVMNLNGEEIFRAKDEIYARHGQKFNDNWTQNYFDSCTWYEGSRKDEVKKSEFTDVEWANIELLSEKYEEYQTEYPAPEYHAAGNGVTVQLNEEQGEVSVNYTVKGSYEDGFEGVLSIDGYDYSTSEFGIELESPADFYYITAINPYFGGKEIALFDYGMDDNNITYFFTMDNNGGIVYVGDIPGCPFKGQASASCDGFANIGTVTATVRTYILGNGAYYLSYWYDPTEYEFEDNFYEYEFKMVPDGGRMTKKDITLEKYLREGEEENIDIEAGTEVFFMATDDRTQVYIKTKDGREGYLDVTPEMTANPDKYFDMNY